MIIEKYELNKNWGVPFEIEHQIDADFIKLKNRSEKAGIWLAIVEIANKDSGPTLVERLIKDYHFEYEECLEWMREIEDNKRTIRPIVEKIFKRKNHERRISSSCLSE